MHLFYALPIIALISAAILFIFGKIVKNKKSLETIVFGITIILVGAIFGVDKNLNLSGYEFIIILFGLLLSILGYIKK